LKRVIISILTGALLVGTAGMSFAADEKGGRIKQRKEKQQERIAKGVENGSLNAKEAARIERNEAKLNKEIRRDRQDGGGLTNKEKAKINRQQNKISKEIYKEKHDGQTQK